MMHRPAIIGYEDYEVAKYVAENLLVMPLTALKTEDHHSTENIIFKVPIYTTTNQLMMWKMIDFAN
jgi:hypothetical protein